jgi:hypothetical protein
MQRCTLHVSTSFRSSSDDLPKKKVLELRRLNMVAYFMGKVLQRSACHLTLAHCLLDWLSPWNLRPFVSPKYRWNSTELRAVNSQKIILSTYTNLWEWCLIFKRRILIIFYGFGLEDCTEQWNTFKKGRSDVMCIAEESVNNSVALVRKRTIPT